MSSLTERRGLKLVTFKEYQALERVVSHRETWIETVPTFRGVDFVGGRLSQRDVD